MCQGQNEQGSGGNEPQDEDGRQRGLAALPNGTNGKILGSVSGAGSTGATVADYGGNVIINQNGNTPVFEDQDGRLRRLGGGHRRRGDEDGESGNQIGDQGGNNSDGGADEEQPRRRRQPRRHRRRRAPAPAAQSGGGGGGGGGGLAGGLLGGLLGGIL